ncbi:MAG TPA: alpha/beta hydrolase-fold protein [Ktedonobacteraceae bacterium]
MKEKNLSSKKRLSLKRTLPVLQFFVSLLLAVLGGVFLFQPTIFNGLTNAVISVGLDTLRSQLIAALIMTAGSALIGAVLGRRKLGAFIGAGIIFCNGFLIGFFQQQRQPLLDPGGHPEPLNAQALYGNSTIILGLGLLSAFIGLAVGIALGEAVLDPPYRLLRFFWQYFTQKRSIKTDSDPTRSMPFDIITRWFGAAIVVILIILAANSSNLFIFSPDTGIHTHPVFRDSAGKVVTGTVVSGSLISPSLNNQHRSFLIYLPPSYNTPEGKTRSYPTLYLLHGTPGKDLDWIVGGKAAESADTLIALRYIPELIMVFPDGNGRPGATSEWGNSYDQHQLMENFVANDLVKYIDQHYRTIPDTQHRGIGGLSMGGFGAMNIAIHHPDIFGNVMSFGGYYKAEGSIWGSNPYYQQLNSPLSTIVKMPQAWQLQIFIGAATKDQPYYRDTLQFRQVLDQLHIHYHFDLQVGQHSWSVWQKQMYNALEWLPWNQQQSLAHTKLLHPPT